MVTKMSKIYAIDFDGTLCKGVFPSIGNPRTEIIDYVKKLKEDGNKIILWTCRVDDLLEDAVAWCKDQEIEFDAINENLKETVEKYNGDSRKVTADFYIDDKNLLIDELIGGDDMNRSVHETRQTFFNTDFKVRESQENEDKFLEGYFIKFNDPTELWEGVYEEVRPESITDSLKNNDIRCLFNHDSGVVLGRSGNTTLELVSDDKGLLGRVKINPNDKQAMDVLARVERGDITGCSFGFNVKRNGEELLENEDGTVKFILKDIDLREVSVVTFPAYPTTSIEARSKDLEHYRTKKLELIKNKLRERLGR